jgi:hypothetical protein
MVISNFIMFSESRCISTNPCVRVQCSLVLKRFISLSVKVLFMEIEVRSGYYQNSLLNFQLSV